MDLQTIFPPENWDLHAHFEFPSANSREPKYLQYKMWFLIKIDVLDPNFFFWNGPQQV